MAKAQDIHQHMEVLGSDGKHVGTVDHMEGASRIKLSSSDPQAGGKHHVIAIDWVERVDERVHLNKTSAEAMKRWHEAA